MKRLFLLSLCFLLASCGSVAPKQTTIPSELTVAEYPLKQQPDAEYAYPSFADSVEGNPYTVHEDERANTFDWSMRSCPAEAPVGMCAKLGAGLLSAHEEYNDLGQGHVIVTRNGEKIYIIPVGHGSPVNALRGLWVYDNHWVLETATYVEWMQTDGKFDNEVIGDVAIDGKSLNEEFFYHQSFGFQTIHGRPFYFFQRGDGKIDANYNGQYIPLGYDEIPHYGCCSAAALNPLMYQNMVTFFARKGETWYYAEIGVFGQP